MKCCIEINLNIIYEWKHREQKACALVDVGGDCGVHVARGGFPGDGVAGGKC